MVVSRQESDIQHALGSHSAVYRYPLGIDSVANQEDISEFIRHRLDQIRAENEYLSLDSDWPGGDKISTLTKSAGGLFVWALTACLYIDGYDPDRKLKELITQHSEIKISEPFAQLDKLYKTGMQSAGFWNDSSFRSDCHDILGAVLCARIPLSCFVIDSLLDLPPNRACLQSISCLECVLRISETEGIRILHPWFHDYLSERCGGEHWSINLELHNKELTLRCIQLLDNELRENICNTTLPYMTGNETVPKAISYACKFWIEHTCPISDAMDDIVDQIYDFLVKHLLHWMEALALLKCHDHAIRSIQNLIEWLLVCHPICIIRTCH